MNLGLPWRIWTAGCLANSSVAFLQRSGSPSPLILDLPIAPHSWVSPALRNLASQPHPETTSSYLNVLSEFAKSFFCALDYQHDEPSIYKRVQKEDVE